jgi:hypothetical protein
MALTLAWTAVVLTLSLGGLFGCTHGDSPSPDSDPYAALPADASGDLEFLTLGARGKSLKNEFVLYMDPADGTPRCPGCRFVRVAFDDNGEEIRSPHVRFDLSNACDADDPGDPIELEKSDAVAKSSAALLVNANPLACDPAGTLRIELWGCPKADPKKTVKKKSGPAAPGASPEAFEPESCDDLELLKSVETTLAQVKQLKPTTTKDLPSR